MNDCDVLVFRADAAATADNTVGLPVGQTHAVLVFLREPAGASPNSEKAAAELGRRGWFDINISEAGPVSVASLDSVHPKARAAYQDALNDGFAALVFSEPITSNDLTNRSSPPA